MAIVIVCPSCECEFKVKDEFAGRKVRCPECGETVAASDGARPSREDRAGGRGGEDAIQTAPRSGPRSGPPPRRRFEEEEEASRPRRRSREEVEEQDRSERSRRRPGREKTGSSGLVIGLIVGGVGLVVAIVVVVVLMRLSAPAAAPVAGNAAGGGAAKDGDAGQKAPAPPVANVVKAPAIKFAVQPHAEKSEHVLLGGPDNRYAAVFFRSASDGKLVHFLDRYEVSTAKSLGRTSLGELRGPELMSLSPSGTLFAAKEVLTENKKFESAVTIWSLTDGKVLQSKWRPYPGGDIFKMLALISFLDDNRLLTLTTHRLIGLWNLKGESLYSVKHDNPAKQFDNQNLDPYTKLPQNFALSGDHSSLALASGGSFDIIDTATGKVRAKTAAFVTKENTVKGLALNTDASRLAVYLWTVKGQGVQESVAICDLKANQISGPFAINVKKEKDAKNLGWSGNALSWWKADHLLLWGGNGNALVLEAATGQPLRELLGPHKGSYGHGDSDGRLWYECDSPGQVQPFLCAVDFPAEVAQRDRALEEGQYYPRWWLTQNGIETQAESGDSRLGIFPRVGPAR